jgi:hypothetical protein
METLFASNLRRSRYPKNPQPSNGEPMLSCLRTDPKKPVDEKNNKRAYQARRETVDQFIAFIVKRHVDQRDRKLHTECVDSIRELLSDAFGDCDEFDDLLLRLDDENIIILPEDCAEVQEREWEKKREDKAAADDRAYDLVKDVNNLLAGMAGTKKGE